MLSLPEFLYLESIYFKSKQPLWSSGNTSLELNIELVFFHPATQSGAEGDEHICKPTLVYNNKGKGVVCDFNWMHLWTDVPVNHKLFHNLARWMSRRKTCIHRLQYKNIKGLNVKHLYLTSMSEESEDSQAWISSLMKLKEYDRTQRTVKQTVERTHTHTSQRAENKEAFCKDVLQMDPFWRPALYSLHKYVLLHV